VFEPSTTLQSRAWVEVRLDRLRENALAVQSALGPDRALIPMVKANGYGLGLEPVARALQGTPGLAIWAFGVAAVAEGEELRRTGWAGRLLVFSPVPPGELERAADADLTLCLSDVESVRSWAALASRLGRPLALHSEVDTGMGRAGFPWDRAAQWGPALRAELGPLEWEGCFTHFHSADAPDLRSTEEQWRRFRAALDALEQVAPAPLVVHVANSAASLREGGFGADLGRPGIFMYGGAAGPGTTPAPVAAVRARISLVREVEPGTTVGYGAEYAATRRERWGTLAIGYGDGVPRALWRGGGEVLVGGRRVPIIGRISMDATTIDLTAVPDAEPGDVATLLGRDGDEEITVDQLASRCGTISYEILTGLTPRLPRVYLDAGEEAG
jgi:alanine racemase